MDLTKHKFHHIEFIGMMGSGKTTYFKIMNDLLHQKFGQYFGPRSSYMSIISDTTILPGFLSILPDFILKKMSHFLIKKIFTTDFYWKLFYSKNTLLVDSLKKMMVFNDLKNKYQSEEYKYFEVLSTYYQIMVFHKKNNGFLIDEGFLIVIKHFLIDENFQIITKNIFLIDLIPKANIIINCQISSDVALSRIKLRKAGIPKYLRKFNENEQIKILETIGNMNSKLVELIRDNGVIVLNLNTFDSIESNTEILRVFINEVLEKSTSDYKS